MKNTMSLTLSEKSKETENPSRHLT